MAQRGRITEFLVGVFIIAAILALFFLAFKVSGAHVFSGSATYTVSADFDNIGGLQSGAPVSVAGVTVGRVTNITLDTDTMRAHVVMAINDSYNKLPVDSTASIMTQGILGSNYIGLTAGFATQGLKNGDKLVDTHSALILENVIGQLLFSLKDSDKK